MTMQIHLEFNLQPNHKALLCKYCIHPGASLEAKAFPIVCGRPPITWPTFSELNA